MEPARDNGRRSLNMTFISFAQNYEDVMLYRALKNVDKGFYIDVGANDPVIDSVTKAFYERGWRGINIEPVAGWYAKLKQKRPEDNNIQGAVGAHKGEVGFYEVVDTGLSTMEKAIAERHAKEGGYEVKSYQVPLITLTEICLQQKTQEIHFLKIDVEGAEQSVLEGLDLKKIRPWIILVESTLPNTQIDSYQGWEELLTDREYHFVYFDGLNRYYIANERKEIDSAFNAPPNFFDHFKRCNEDWAEKHNQKLQNELNEIKILEGERSFSGVDERVAEAEKRAVAAEVRAKEAEIRAGETEILSIEAESQKNSYKSQISELNAIAKEKGAQLEQLQEKIDELQSELSDAEGLAGELKSRIKVLEARAVEAETRAKEAESRANSYKSKVNEINTVVKDQEIQLKQRQEENQGLKAELETVHASNHHHWNLSELRETHINAIYNSLSWRLTAPLRWVGAHLISVCNFFRYKTVQMFERAKKLCVAMLIKLIRLVLRHQGLSNKVNNRLLRFPRLHAWLIRIVSTSPESSGRSSDPSEAESTCSEPPSDSVENLTATARAVYEKLQASLACRFPDES